MGTEQQFKLDPRLAGAYNNVADSIKNSKNKESIDALIKEAVSKQAFLDNWNATKADVIKRLLTNEDYKWVIRNLIGARSVYKKKNKRAEMSTEEIYELCLADMYSDLYRELTEGEL